MKLHKSVSDGYKEFVIKDDEGFRIVLQKHEVLRPKGLFSVNLVQQSFKDGELLDISTYNFFMTKEEMAVLAHGLLI
jgi:hypothetical protein